MLKHLACIMDGNRRWAQQRGWLPWLGHSKGLETAELVMNFCVQNNIKFLSLYTFSIENFNRPGKELDYLFNHLAHELLKKVEGLVEKGIRLRFIGDRDLFPKTIIPLCQEIEERTHDCSRLQVNLLFCYGARQEIMSGIKNIIRKIKDGIISEDEISSELFEQHLWTNGIPEPELIIRTGGVKRLSNFLLYQSAYSELYFLDCLWPEITEDDLKKAIVFFNKTQRNFGI